MASNFPNSIDAFINPQYTKVNGVDYVKSEHVNDLQDAVRNVQLMIIGSGLSMGIGSNNYVPATADIKSAIEILDGEVKAREDDFDAHFDAVMLTDPIQHHANVIEVTPIGFLTSNKLQPALEEFQHDIDMIMSGGIVNSVSLDTRYILAGGPALITGTLEVQGDVHFRSNTILGDSASHSVTTSGDMSIGRNLTVTGESTFLDDILIPDVSKIGASSNSEFTHLAFASDKVSLKSFKSIEFQIDSDDGTDGVADDSHYSIANGSGTTIFNLLENGQLTVQSKVITTGVEANAYMQIGSGLLNRIENNKMATEDDSLLLQVDSGNATIGDFFAVTQDGDNGTIDTSNDILIKTDSSKIIAGNHVLKRSVPENGYYGIKFYSENAGGRFHGYGVNFKSKMMNTPSSITLLVDSGESENYSNLSVTAISEYGFFVECDSIAVGNCEVKGTYETVGN